MTRTVCLVAAAVLLSASKLGAQELTRTELVVLADLSNRIDPKLHPGQINRDTTVLRIIADEFLTVVKKNRYLFSRDRMRALFIGGVNLPSEPRVDVAQMNADRRVVVKEIGKDISTFVSEASKPYLEKNPSYIGADLWSWFKHSAKPAFGAVDPTRKTRNRIIMLTDGYLEFAPSIKRDPGTAMMMRDLRGKKNWEQLYQTRKLLPPGYRFPPDTKILVLELAPLRPAINTTEQEILERYWTDWFASMGATVEFRTTAEAMPSVRDAIRQFLN